MSREYLNTIPCQTPSIHRIFCFFLIRILIVCSLFLMSYACKEETLKSNPSSQSNPLSQNSALKLESTEQAVIYGEDNRLDIYQIPETDPFKKRALSSILAMVEKDSIAYDNPDDIRFFGRNFGRSYGLCADEPFYRQPMIASCSATLIDDDLIVTAGHCVTSQNDCLRKAFIFGLYMDDPEDRAIIPESYLYYCQQLEKQVLNPNLDYAFIRLDRPVDRTLFEPAPLPDLLHQTYLQVDDELVLIGFPAGLPMKYAPGGKVTSPRVEINDYIRATVDSYGGNSGSGVFNAQGQQIGILVRGEEDFTRDPNRNCTRSNVLSENRGVEDSAEEIVRLQRAIEELCASGYQSTRLCGDPNRLNWCGACESDQQCVDGWLCRPHAQYPNGPKFCASPCHEQLPCRGDHLCIDGFCEPKTENRCIDDQIAIYNICDQEVALDQVCTGDFFCQGGQCINAAEGDRCDRSIELLPQTQTLQVDLHQGYDDNEITQCQNDFRPVFKEGLSADIYYHFRLDTAQRMVFQTRGIDTILSIRQICEDPTTQLICNDDLSAMSSMTSRVIAELNAGDYYLIADSVTALGRFDLSVEVCQATCQIGEKRCEGQNVYQCEVAENGCLAWQLSQTCSALEICENQSCILAGQGDLCTFPFEMPSLDQNISNIVAPNFHLEHENACNQLFSSELVDFYYQFELTTPTKLALQYQGEIGSIAINRPCESLDMQCQSLENINLYDLPAGIHQIRINAEKGAFWILNLDFTAQSIESLNMDQSVLFDQSVSDQLISDQFVTDQLMVDDQKTSNDQAESDAQVDISDEAIINDQALFDMATIKEDGSADALIFPEYKPRKTGCEQGLHRQSLGLQQMLETYLQILCLLILIGRGIFRHFKISFFRHFKKLIA